MAYDSNELGVQGSDLGPNLRVDATSIQPKTFAAGSGTLPLLAMVAFNTSTGFWQVYGGLTDEVNTVTANATPATDGTFTLTVNGDETAAIDHDADAAAVQAALEALAGVEVGDVTCAMTTGTDLGDANAVVEITWSGNLAGQDITISIDVTGLTGNAHVLATATAGGDAEANGTDALKGFVWPEAIELASGGEVIGNVMMAGTLHRDDVPLVSGSYGQVEVDAALRTQARALNIHVQGLDDVR